MVIRRGVRQILALILAVSGWLASSFAQGEPASAIGDRITGATFFGGELWLRNDKGRIASSDPSATKLSIRLDSGAIDFQATSGALWALVAPIAAKRGDQAAGTFTVARWTGKNWVRSAPMSYEKGNPPLALALHAAEPVVLTRTTIYIFNEGSSRWRKLTLRDTLFPPVPIGLVSAVFSSGGYLYVGTNAGEWGGSLVRVDLAERSVSRVAGPFVDPVTGIVPIRDSPHCVFASSGLSHMGMWSGDVAKVCDAKASVVFEKSTIRGKGDTEPVFSLQESSPNGFWAATPLAVYHFANGKMTRQSLPVINGARGLSISAVIPGIIVLKTGANMAHSVSGYTPLIVATGRD